jgi:hypothetical protein
VLLAQLEDERFTPWKIARIWGNGLQAWHVVLMRKVATHKRLELNEEWQQLKAKTPLMLVPKPDKMQEPEADTGT